jgi:hypothetical protein
MIHVFKSGGDWDIGGKSFDVKCINDSDLQLYIDHGYCLNKEDCAPDEPKPKARSRKVVKDDAEQS